MMNVELVNDGPVTIVLVLICSSVVCGIAVCEAQTPFWLLSDYFQCWCCVGYHSPMTMLRRIQRNESLKAGAAVLPPISRRTWSPTWTVISHSKDVSRTIAKRVMGSLKQSEVAQQKLLNAAVAIDKRAPHWQLLLCRGQREHAPQPRQ